MVVFHLELSSAGSCFSFARCFSPGELSGPLPKQFLHCGALLRPRGTEWVSLARTGSITVYEVPTWLESDWEQAQLCILMSEPRVSCGTSKWQTRVVQHIILKNNKKQRLLSLLQSLGPEDLTCRSLEAPAAPTGVVGLLLFRLLSWVLARQSRTGGTDPPVVPLVLTAGTMGFGEQFWVRLM